VPVMALTQRAGLAELIEAYVRPGGPCGVNAEVKVGCLAAGMVAGADSIGDLDCAAARGDARLVRRPAAPSTLGSFLRTFTWGTCSRWGRSTGNCWLSWSGALNLRPDQPRPRSWHPHRRPGAPIWSTKQEAPDKPPEQRAANGHALTTPITPNGINSQTRYSSWIEAEASPAGTGELCVVFSVYTHIDPVFWTCWDIDAEFGSF
jgi:hypothetical protein